MVKPSQKSVGLIEDIFMQGDSRYRDNWAAYMVASFLENKGIKIEKRLITSDDNPSEAELRRIPGPQQIYKLTGKKLLESEGYKVVSFERPFCGGRVDILAKHVNNGHIIALECCSCRITTVFDYLQQENTSLWIISLGTGLPEDSLPLYIINKGPNWDKCIELYKLALAERLKEIKSPLDSL